MPEDCCEIIGIPAGAFSSELDASLVLGGSDEVDGEVSDDRHVFRAVPDSETRLIVAEGDVENPMQAVLDGPVGANGFGCAGSAEQRG